MEFFIVIYVQQEYAILFLWFKLLFIVFEWVEFSLVTVFRIWIWELLPMLSVQIELSMVWVCFSYYYRFIETVVPG